MKNAVIYTGAFRFPEGDAAAARVLGIGKALRAGGYDLLFAGWEECGRHEDQDSFCRYWYQGFQYFSQNEFRTQNLPAIRRLLRYFRAGEHTLSWLGKLNLSDVKAVIAYHGNSYFLIQLHLFCRRHDIPLYLDCTEWYDASHQVGGRFGIVAIDNAIRMRLVNKLIGRILPISRYLEDYYKSRGCKVLRVPPLVDLLDAKWDVVAEVGADREKLRLVYAGVPGRKDLIGNALLGLLLLKRDGVQTELLLIGPTRNDVINCLGEHADAIDELDDIIIYSGKIPQSSVPQHLATADFSILLRPQKRYAHAGFSTKLVESLAAGLPVIANITGDIASYVTDGVNGILVADHSPEAFVHGVKRAISLTMEQRRAMRRCAREEAERSFDYHSHVQQLSDFIRER